MTKIGSTLAVRLPATALVSLALVSLVLVSLALVGAGCGGDDDDTSGTTTEATDTTTTDTDTTDETDTTGSALKGSVGPGFVISVTTEDGDPVETLSAGSYQIDIEDLSSAHNFHLAGPAVEISTDVAETGPQSVPLELVPGTYTFVCDPHAAQMSGSFTVT